ncbi:UDP-3-O-acyl-N-acetylglucosamine deacetylase, partial [Desulfurella sp.]|uniref:UDP-3-O-acyl-N-acetylglucosamine deacetylase n=1 Tax=Desulfurella sp. TaxID=1962857 RepID=UPI0025BB745F
IKWLQEAKLRKQRTIKETVKVSGIGVHTGKKVDCIIEPAPDDTGIVFHRTDKNIFIPVNQNNVVDTTLSTTIGLNGVYIKTVEHLLASLYALNIDNCIIKIDNEEVPILDGSSAPWVYLLKSASYVEQKHYKKVLIITKPVKIKENGKFVALLPCRKFKISYAISFEGTFINKQKYELEINEQTFIKEISKARTFCFLRDIEYMQQNNLALGGSLDNAVVVDDYGVVNEDPLRYENEFVRHKILDAIGDLSILNYDLKAHYIAYKSGHNLNYKLVSSLLKDKKSYVIIGSPKQEAQVLEDLGFLSPVVG